MLNTDTPVHSPTLWLANRQQSQQHATPFTCTMEKRFAVPMPKLEKSSLHVHMYMYISVRYILGSQTSCIVGPTLCVWMNGRNMCSIEHTRLVRVRVRAWSTYVSHCIWSSTHVSHADCTCVAREHVIPCV